MMTAFKYWGSAREQLQKKKDALIFFKVLSHSFSTAVSFSCWNKKSKALFNFKIDLF